MNVHLAGGGAVVTMPRFDLELFLRINQDYKAQRMWIVPPVALALAKHPMIDQFDLSSVEQVFSGAAPLGAELSNAVQDRLSCVSLQGYGMTETSPVSFQSSTADPLDRRVSTVGRIQPRLEAAGVREPLRFTSALTDGETLWAFRWASDDQAPSLYYRMGGGDGLTIASEPPATRRIIINI